MKKNNKTLKETFALALHNYKNKDFKSAELHCRKILSIDPNHFDSIFLLATLSAIQRNFNEAKKLLYKAIEIQPNNVSAHNNLGNVYEALGEFDRAINCYQKIIKIKPNHTNAYYNLGLVFYKLFSNRSPAGEPFLKLKELNRAKSYFQKTVEIQTNFAAAHFNLGNIHVELKEFQNAANCYQKAIELRPDHIGAYNNLGLVFEGLNDFENAISSYQKAIENKPEHVGAHHNLALAFKGHGEFEKAIKSHQMAIKYEPENSIHYYYLSELKKDILDNNLKKKIEKIIGNINSTKSNIAYGNYILSKYERKIKNYKKELDYLIRGHQCFFESKKTKFELGIKYCFDDVIQITKSADLNKLNSTNDYKIKPIFIVGVPRCGSTLLEKVIASGKQLIPIGEETSVFENFINKTILKRKSLNLGDLKSIRTELYDIYEQKKLISKKYDYIFTDKSLNNFFYLKLIKKIYPNAKIINCRRDVLSSIMSIFQNNLTELAWTHNLENIFKYFNNYFEITENFSKRYPNFIYQLQFEKLVNDPETESKKLMKFCALPWDKKCLEFYKRKDLISKTTSNVQIRKAIYKHSLDKYLPYKQFLDKYGKRYSWFN